MNSSGVVELYPPSLTIIGNTNQIIRAVIIRDMKPPPAEGHNEVVVPLASQ